MSTINLNDTVWIRLTDAGLEILRKRHAELKATCPGVRDWTPPEIDAKGYSKDQLWHLFECFGPSIWLGNANLPFGTEILTHDPMLGAPETIERAASKHHGVIHSVPKPGRHGTVIVMLSKAGLCGPTDPVTGPDGFITSAGRFVEREEAWKLAEAAGQLLPRAPTDHKGGTLYSEDVW